MHYSRYFAWLSALILAIAFASFNLYLAILFAGLFLIGLADIIQTQRSILRNYPLTGHLRFLLEYIRPEIRQYFLRTMRRNYPSPEIKGLWFIADPKRITISEGLVQLSRCIAMKGSG